MLKQIQKQCQFNIIFTMEAIGVTGMTGVNNQKGKEKTIKSQQQIEFVGYDKTKSPIYVINSWLISKEELQSFKNRVNNLMKVNNKLGTIVIFSNAQIEKGIRKKDQITSKEFISEMVDKLQEDTRKLLKNVYICDYFNQMKKPQADSLIKHVSFKQKPFVTDLISVLGPEFQWKSLSNYIQYSKIYQKQYLYKSKTKSNLYKSNIQQYKTKKGSKTPLLLEVLLKNIQTNQNFIWSTEYIDLLLIEEMQRSLDGCQQQEQLQEIIEKFPQYTRLQCVRRFFDKLNPHFMSDKIKQIINKNIKIEDKVKFFKNDLPKFSSQTQAKLYQDYCNTLNLRSILNCVIKEMGATEKQITIKIFQRFRQCCNKKMQAETQINKREQIESQEQRILTDIIAKWLFSPLSECSFQRHKQRIFVLFVYYNKQIYKTKANQ